MRAFLLTLAITCTAAAATLAFIPFASAHIEAFYARQAQADSEEIAPVVQQNSPERCNAPFVKLAVALSGKVCE